MTTINGMRPTISDGRAAADRIEELEAKLAKAVEALRYALDGAAYSYEGMNFEGEYSDELATLAELTGENHE